RRPAHGHGQRRAQPRGRVPGLRGRRLGVQGRVRAAPCGRHDGAREARAEGLSRTWSQDGQSGYGDARAVRERRRGRDILAPMLRTPLYLKHAELGARLVEFAGYEMPLHYQGGINEEHLAVRTGAGVFDVSHMAEVRVAGPDATAFLAYATLNDPARLKVGRGQYSMLPNDSGGVIDDLF